MQRNAETGMSGLLSDADFFRLLTTDKNGKRVDKLVNMVLKHYPELARFV
jgi:hypothetical protein